MSKKKKQDPQGKDHHAEPAAPEGKLSRKLYESELTPTAQARLPPNFCRIPSSFNANTSSRLAPENNNTGAAIS